MLVLVFMKIKARKQKK